MGVAGIFITLCLFTKVFARLKTSDNLPEMSDYKDHPCVRTCEDGAPPMRCEYIWILEVYAAFNLACFNCPFTATDCYRPHCLSADGQKRGVLTANRHLPGPEIQVCEGDLIVVNVHNAMETAGGTTIHWHGLLQYNTAYMDGVNLITQCPIPVLSTFQYRFRAEDVGTHWWHSHAGIQRSDGLFGNLVIRQSPSRDPHSGLYDYDLPEHVISVTDWLPEMTDQRFSSFHHDLGDNKPSTILINGRGARIAFTDTPTGEIFYTPYEEFEIEPGMRYRFRIISAGSFNCPIQFSVDGHKLLMITSDGNGFEPIEVDSFNIFSGERYDFVLTASEAVDNYWIRAYGQAECTDNQAHQLAVLRYSGASSGLPTADSSYEAGARSGINLNPLNKEGSDTEIPLDALISTDPDDESLIEEPDKKFYLTMDFNMFQFSQFQEDGLYPPYGIVRGSYLFSPQINYLSFSLPGGSLLTQPHDYVEDEEFCDPESASVDADCKSVLCACTHRLKVDLGDVVELIIIDEGKLFDASHPMHIHGYKFRVIGLERVGVSTTLEEVKQLDENGQLKRKYTGAVYKDTVTIPDGGYTVLRFKADNPGMWFLHCHLEFHTASGMGLVIQVGEPSDFPKTPRDFPTCGDWSLKTRCEDRRRRCTQ